MFCKFCSGVVADVGAVKARTLIVIYSLNRSKRLNTFVVTRFPVICTLRELPDFLMTKATVPDETKLATNRSVKSSDLVLFPGLSAIFSVPLPELIHVI
jgi:hypothetical protein